jgi:hypothetical protein
LHDGGCIGGQERRIFVGEMAWLDAPDRGDEGRALGFGEAWRRLKTMASRIERRGLRRLTYAASKAPERACGLS